jgi:hypothetical protein
MLRILVALTAGELLWKLYLREKYVLPAIGMEAKHG